MQFCSNDNNLLRYQIVQGKPVLNCLHCNYTFESPSAVIQKTTIRKENHAVDMDYYKYMAYDNTLPRTTKFKCPNVNCKANPGRTAVFSQKDEKMKRVYTCLSCHAQW